jgi:hypothetical protein
MVPFAPRPGATVNIDVASTTANVQVTTEAVPCQVRVMNNGTATAWIRFGTDNTVAATLAASVPVGPNGTEVFTTKGGPVWVAAIAAGSTGKIYFTPGVGI